MRKMNMLKSAIILKSPSNSEVLRTRFEGREAIYVEKGALRVRVNNIHNLQADVEEIPTPGLGVGLWRLHRPGTSPLRWTIGGDPTSNSDQSWSSYAGWILYFAPEVVQAVIEFAARCSNNPDAIEDYKGLCHLLRDRTRMRMI